jgi:acyl carrier protein
LTANGKVDRQALPLPEGGRAGSTRPFVPPRNPAEQLMADIWQGVLKIEQVGIYDNFFDLGGHSLLATQVVSRIRTTFQVELPLRTLFETPTIAELVTTLLQYQAEQADDDLLAEMMAELEGLTDEELAIVMAAEQQLVEGMTVADE